MLLWTKLQRFNAQIAPSFGLCRFVIRHVILASCSAYTTRASVVINVDYSIFKSMKRRQQCMNTSGRDCQLTKLMQFSQDEGDLFFLYLC
jgi:hypothetical protein